MVETASRFSDFELIARFRTWGNGRLRQPLGITTDQLKTSLLLLLAIVVAGCSSSTADEATEPRKSVEVTPPDWANLSSLYTGSRVSIGGYPLEGEFGRNGTGIVQGIVGAVQVPANISASNHSAGVAGYARTSSVTNMAVGVHGFGGVMQDGGLAEGGHFLTTNCGAQYCEIGVDASNLFIIEADINLMRTPKGNPTGNAFGLIFFGAGNAVPDGLFQAVRIDSPGVFQKPVIPWKEGVVTADGAATVGMSLGKQSIADSSASQPLVLRSSADGNQKQSVIQAAAGGDLVLSAGSGTAVVDGWGLRISKAQAPTSSSMPCVTGQIQWDSGHVYVCIAANHWRRSALSDF